MQGYSVMIFKENHLVMIENPNAQIHQAELHCICSVDVFGIFTSMVENGGREKSLATHSSKFRPKQLKKDQM